MPRSKKKTQPQVILIKIILDKPRWQHFRPTPGIINQVNSSFVWQTGQGQVAANNNISLNPLAKPNICAIN